MDAKQFQFVDKNVREIPEEMRPSLTYWQDAWRRLKNHRMAMVGLVGVILIVLSAVFGPLFSRVSYSDQNLDYANVPPRMKLYELDTDFYVFLTSDYKLLQVSRDGRLVGRLSKVASNPIKKLFFTRGRKLPPPAELSSIKPTPLVRIFWGGIF